MTELNFNSSVRRIVVRVPILQDTFSEGTEQFRASLSLVQSNGINVAVSPDQATVDIIDDEGEWVAIMVAHSRYFNTLLAVVAVIGFVRNMVVVNESDLSAALTVRVCSGELAPDTWAEVEFTTSDMPSADTSAAVCKYTVKLMYKHFIAEQWNLL